MVWQDFVLAGGGFVLTAGLLPMLRSAERPPVRTSLTLLAVLSSYVVTLATLELWVAAAGTALQAAIWGGARRAADAVSTPRPAPRQWSSRRRAWRRRPGTRIRHHDTKGLQ